MVLLQSEKGSRIKYDFFISQSPPKRPLCDSKCVKVVSLQDDYDCKCVFNNLQSLTKDTSLFLFQYRSVQPILRVDKHLHVHHLDITNS